MAPFLQTPTGHGQARAIGRVNPTDPLEAGLPDMFSVPLSDILVRGNNNFDLVRITAAASVIVSHAFAQVYGAATAEPLASLSVYTLGQHAVNIFFLLSGLLVSASLDRTRSLVAFATSRSLRIFPGLIVCVVVVAFILGPIVTTHDVGAYLISPDPYSYVVGTVALVSTAAPLPGVFDTLPEAGAVNTPLWTLKYEVLVYAALVIIAAVGIWRRPLLFWLFFSLLVFFHTAAEVRHDHPDDHVMLDHLLRFMFCFFLGSAAYRLRNVVRLSAHGALLAAALLLVINGTILEESIGYGAVGYLILCFAALPMNSLRMLSARGDISYGLYIYGWPVAQSVLLIAPDFGAIELAVVSLVVASLLAAASWLLIERPTLNLKRIAIAPPHPHRLARTCQVAAS